MSRRESFFQKKIKQKKPFHSLIAEAAVGLLITGDVLRRNFSALVQQGDVSFQQFNVLRILRGSGVEGLPTREIAARMVEKSPGITRFIDQLEARELVKRRRSTSDRRQVFCMITQSGLDLLSKFDQPVDEWDEHSLSVLNERELKQLIDFLERIYSYQTNLTRGGAHAKSSTG